MSAKNEKIAAKNEKIAAERGNIAAGIATEVLRGNRAKKGGFRTFKITHRHARREKLLLFNVFLRSAV